jgi:hypothetical protein
MEELEKYSIVKWDKGKRVDVTLVDSGLVCRVFLEFYRAQKLAKFAKVKHACKSYRDLEKEDQQLTAMGKKVTLSALGTILKAMGSSVNLEHPSPAISALESPMNKFPGPGSLKLGAMSLDPLKPGEPLEDFEKIDESSLGFHGFSSLIREFYKGTSLSETLELYSNSYCYGAGKISLESFYIAAQESCFFLRDMDLAPPTSHTPALTKAIQKRLHSLDPLIILLRKELPNLGCEKPRLQFEEFLKTFKDGFIYPSALLKGERILGYWFRFKEFLMGLVHRVLVGYSGTW